MLDQINAGGVLPVAVPDSGEIDMISGVVIFQMALEPEAGGQDNPPPYPPPR